MKFENETVYEIVSNLNDNYYIPAFQRDLTWNETQMVDFFDSLLNEYYIGALLFWEDTSTEQRQAYKFIQNYIPDPVHPESINGRTKGEITKVTDQATYVLDGQQRLTTLYLGLFGKLWKRTKNKKRKNENSWYSTQLCIDLFTDRSDDFSLSFRKDPHISEKEFWMPLPKIIESMEKHGAVNNKTDKVEMMKSVNKQMSTIAEKEGVDIDSTKNDQIQYHIRQIYNQILERSNLNYYTIEQENTQKIHQIFVKINKSGTKISPEQIILSRITPEWKKIGLVPRKEFTEFSDRINSNIDNIGAFELNPDLLTKILYTCSDDKNTTYRNKTNDEKFAEEWKNGTIQESIEKTFTMLDNQNAYIKTNQAKYIGVYAMNQFLKHNDCEEIPEDFRTDLLLLVYISATTSGRTQKILEVLKNIDISEGIDFQKLENNLQEYGETLQYSHEYLLEKFTNKLHNRTKLFIPLIFEQHYNSPDLIDDNKDRSISNLNIDHELCDISLTEQERAENYSKHLQRKIREEIKPKY